MNLNGDPVPGSHWLLPSAAPVVRAGLCSLAQPSLRQARHTPRFLFHEACLLLVAAGRLDLHDGSHQTTVDTPSCLLLVQAHTSADLMKTPGSGGQPFRSVLLALSPELLEAFHRTRAQPAALPLDEQAFRQLPLDDDLQDALRQVLASVPSPTLSDERLRYRLMDLLAALAERGHLLRRAGRPARPRACAPSLPRRPSSTGQRTAPAARWP